MMPRAMRRPEVACIRRLLLHCGLRWRCTVGIVRRASEYQGNREQSCSDPPRHERLPATSGLRCRIAKANADRANRFCFAAQD
jgi:hypothetical protein